MLPELTKYNGMNPNNWYMSEKLNGVRALWNGSEFISKNGKIFNVPEWFKAGLPADIWLDGEIYNGGDLGTMAGLCRKKAPIDSEWQCVTFQVFDVHDFKRDFYGRLLRLDCIPLPAHCKRVEQITCKNAAHLLDFYKAIAAKGGEGAVIKSPWHWYKSGKSFDAFKIKYIDDFEVDDCTIDETGRFICVRDYE